MKSGKNEIIKKRETANIKMTSTRLPFIPRTPGALQITSTTPDQEKYEEIHRDSKHTLFKLTSTGATYRLPNPKELRPYVDCETGALDSWPAHSAKQPLVRQKTYGQNSKDTPKPKFLDRLEKFMIKELKALDCTDPSKPSEKRLQVFQEVFEYLIDDFKTYRPLLSAIKNEYENFIKTQKEKIRELEPLQSLIITISERCDKMLMAAKQDERGEIADLRAENEKLGKVILKMREEEVELKDQLKRLQEEIAKEYRRYRDECDARKLLVQDLNDLKVQEDEAKRAVLGKQDDTQNDDMVVLKLALKKAREDLEARTKKLSEVMANFGDVVPSKDFERLDTQFKAQEKELAEVNDSYQVLMNDHSSLIAVHKKMVQQRDLLAQECEEMRRTSTPRPDWERCGRYVEGGAERWAELSKDQSSNDMVDILLAEMTGQALVMIKNGVGAKELFAGLLNDFEGDPNDIPRFLRCEGELVNRRIGRRDCALLVNDIWKDRVDSKVENPSLEPEDFDVFIYDFLMKRYGTESLAYEWGYNLFDACSRYSHEAKIGMFNNIIGRQVIEKSYHDYMEMVTKLSRAISQECDAAGSITSESLRSVLTHSFPWKDGPTIDALINAAAKDNEENATNFESKNLLEEDSEGFPKEFLTELERQDEKERVAYVNEIDEKLESETGNVTFEEARQAFMSVDPTISEEKCSEYLRRGFGLPADKLQVNLSIEKSSLLSNLSSGSIRRVGSRSV